MSTPKESKPKNRRNCLLKELECDTAQGFFYAKPMPCDEFEKLLSVSGSGRLSESCWEAESNPSFV